VIDGFHRQLRLYAAIIAEATGHWPAQGRVVAASGQTIEVPFVPVACDAEANAALKALDALNQGLASNAARETLGRPTSGACGGCPFQALCPAFWRWLEKSGPQDLPEPAAEGALERIESGYDEDLYTAYITSHCPATSPAEMQPLVLRRSTHGDLTACLPGARLRIVSAKTRPDGRLRADPMTCVFALDDLPTLVTSSDLLGFSVAWRQMAMSTVVAKLPPRRKREPLTRSQIMARIRSKDTRPEVLTRSAVHALGMRFRNHVAALPGKPDLANRKQGWAIFVHGCFWHSHPGCRLASKPKSNTSYWMAKLARNQARDADKVAALRRQGFRVLVIWECDVRDGD
jgi:DNA mismatch endonuclease (patch repair protein)